MNESPLFNILHTVDSTNNYAMAMVHEGLAKHGMAWFAREQTAGKGQRGKHWFSTANSSILLSISLKPSTVFISNPFYLSAVVAVACRDYLQKLAGTGFFLKWPNDLYWRDRKTGGILIENNYSGSTWNWAVVGIGINVNQDSFNKELKQQAISLSQVMDDNSLDPELLARELHGYILHEIDAFEKKHSRESIIDRYNEALYKKGESVRLKKDNAVFSATVKGVNKFGQLITENGIQRVFNFGEIEWILSPA